MLYFLGPPNASKGLSYIGLPFMEPPITAGAPVPNIFGPPKSFFGTIPPSSEGPPYVFGRNLLNRPGPPEGPFGPLPYMGFGPPNPFGLNGGMEGGPPGLFIKCGLPPGPPFPL